MDKAVKMGKTSATGSFQLFVGRIASTLILAIGSILVGIYINAGEYGLYTIALVPATTFLLFQDWGVGPALTQNCAKYRAEKREGELRRIIISGLTFEVGMALALTLVSLMMANFVASTIFHSPESAVLVALASITILSQGIFLASDSIFVGFESMKLSTITLIVSAIVQGLLSPLLVYLGFGAFGALVGYTLGSVASGATAVSLLYFKILRKVQSGSATKTKIFQTVKPLLRYGIPISVATIIGGIAPQLYYFIMASSTDVILIGNYKIATNFAVFLTFFIYPIQTVLFPAFSKLDPLKDKKLLKSVFASSVKYASLFMVPAIMAIGVLSTPLINALYGGKWSLAPFFLTLSVLGYLVVLLGNLSFNRLLYATGETKMLVKLNALTLCIGGPIAFLLIPSLGIIGLILTGYAGGVPAAIIGVYWTWKRYETKADLQNSVRIFLASALAATTTYLLLNTLEAAAWIMLIMGAFIFLTVYLLSIPLVGAINQMDINNLRIMFSGLGPVSKLLEIPLVIIEIPLSFKDRRSAIQE